MFRFGIAAVLLIGMEPLAAGAATCKGTQPTCNQCQHLFCYIGPNLPNGSWVCLPNTNGTSCDDGHYCTVGDTCQNGACVAGSARSCPPQGSCAGVCSDSLASSPAWRSR